MAPMNRTSFRVLETLSRNIGRDLPISSLRDEIEAQFGTAHYKNVHEAVSQLSQAGYLRVDEAGRSRLVSLELTRGETVDLLAEVDLRSSREARDEPLTLPTPTARIADVLLGDPAVGTAFLVDVDVNLHLNRLELVAATRSTSTAEHHEPGSAGGSLVEPDLYHLHERLQVEAAKANVRADVLVLTETELKRGLAATELHPVQVQAKRRRTLVDPQRFWWLVRQARREGPEPRMRAAPAGQTPPLDLVSWIREDRDRLGQHLERFGYTEMGTGSSPVEEACVELVIAAALGSDEPRRRYAAAVLLAKNEVNPRLLAFLATKHDLAGDLLGMLRALEEHPRTPGTETVRPFLPGDSEPADVDRDQIEELLDLYGATP